MRVRDDFKQRTREKLAQRAGYRCSKPDCLIATRGADSTEEGTIDIGVAAHITAAAPGGPRYDPSLSREQRMHISNGVWLCQNHAKLVDSDESQFTAKELRDWKSAAEAASLDAVSSGVPAVVRPAVPPLSGDAVSAMDLLRKLSSADIATFRRTPSWPSHAVDLNLKLVNAGAVQPFTIAGLAAVLETFDEAAVIAQPGTGKTTTLLQLAETVIANKSAIPCFISLSEWATQASGIFESILRRRTFRGAAIEQLELLAGNGKLLLMLDGWNELDDTAKFRVRSELKEIRRNFPDVHILVSSRFSDTDLPVTGPLVNLDFLTFSQQQEIAQALRGNDGRSLLDHAWRTPGLRELVAIPLYLAVLLNNAPGVALPTTKEELLQAFVTEHENDPEKSALLKREIQGFHRIFLGAIAAEAMRRETTALTNDEGRTAVALAQKALLERGQIAQPFAPNKILEALASAHLLVKTGEAGATLGFQHQQFQEWFASLWVEELMLVSAGAPEQKKVLREDVLNLPFWEEAILFACERLSLANDAGARVVAETIVATLEIDPMLSAEMIYRTRDAVWEAVRERVVSFAQRWHAQNKVDRAYQFMVNTGRPEFAEYVWPLISNPNNQIHLRALRAGKRFRIGVLGPDPGPRIAAMAEDLRKHVISELATEGGMDGMELAAAMAASDKSETVQAAVIGALQFRRADRLTSPLLKTASPGVISAVAGQWDAEEFADPEIRQRIAAEQKNAELAKNRPDAALDRLTRHHARDSAVGAEVRTLIASLDFAARERGGSWSWHRAYEAFPDDVARGMVDQLLAGKPLPFSADELLRSSNIEIDEDPITERVLGSTGDRDGAEAAAAVAGPKTIRLLIDRYLGLRRQLMEVDHPKRKDLSDQYHRAMSLITATRASAFASAIMAMAQAKDHEDMAALADLVGRHGRNYDGKDKMRLDDSQRSALAGTLSGWGNTLASSAESTRGQMAEIADAATQVASPTLVPVLERLLSEDLKRLSESLEALRKARAERRPIQNDASMRYSGQYGNAFVAIGNEESITLMKSYLPDLGFGVEAAQVLHRIWRKTFAVEDIRVTLGPSPDFSAVKDRRASPSPESSQTHPFAEAIFEVVEDFLNSDAPDKQKHALSLASVAVNFPYAGKEKTVERLLSLSLPPSGKQRFLTMLALAGEVIPAPLVLQGVYDLLKEGEKNPWMLMEQESWRLFEWLKLLPFTDDPRAVLGVLDRLDAQIKTPWKMRPLLAALGHSPSNEAVSILLAMARSDPRYLGEHDWLAALTRIGSLEAARALGDLVCDEAVIPNVGSNDKMSVVQNLASLIALHPEFRKEIYERYSKLTNTLSIAVVEHAIAEAADEAGVLILLKSAASRRVPMQRTGLYMAMECVIVGLRPSSTGYQEYFGKPAAGLRRSLFHLFLNGNAEESALAQQCLLAIDDIRDNHGSIESEPRHPDISTGVPWPRLQ